MSPASVRAGLRPVRSAGMRAAEAGVGRSLAHVASCR